jgi:N-acetylglucosaminyldiphosphoundecaprenol N-acetyl-beta-D-mannosaminyltransferase
VESRHGHCEFLPGIELWCESKNELLDYLTHRVQAGQTTFIVTLNPLMVMASRHNRDFARVLEKADVIVADGQGVRWAYRKIQNSDVPLIPGVELAEEIIAASSKTASSESASSGQKWNIGFLGGRDNVWKIAADSLKRKYPDIVIKGGFQGYFNQNDEEDIVFKLSEMDLKVLIAGMGSPKQELFLLKHLDSFKGAILIGAGGSLDIYSGQTKRAPMIFRGLKLEWLWRMIKEPSRFSQIFPLMKFWLMVAMRHPSLFKSAIGDKIP